MDVETDNIAIVGLGPWGLCAFERIVTLSRLHQHQHTPDRAVSLSIHLVEPRLPGTGIYDPDQPGYLVMNNACGDIQLYAGDSSDRPSYELSLFRWAVDRGYRWVESECVISTNGRVIQPTDFLPRKVMGAYLNWYFVEIQRVLPDGVKVSLHQDEAIDLIPSDCGREFVVLRTGHKILCDEVICCIGHLKNKCEDAGATNVNLISPYPVTGQLVGIEPAEQIAIAGMGLVAMDTVAALTIGRGGKFEQLTNELRYQPSGSC